MSQNQKVRRDPDLPSFMRPDPTLAAAQRDFEDAGPTWELHPGEQPCAACWLVHPGECF